MRKFIFIKQLLFLLIFVFSLFVCFFGIFKIKENKSKIGTKKNSFEIVYDINKEKVITKKSKFKNKELQNKDSKEPILEIRNLNEEQLNPKNCLVCNLMITDNKMYNDIFLLLKKKFSFKKFQSSKVSKKKESNSDVKLDSQSDRNSIKNNHSSRKSDETKEKNSFKKLISCRKENKEIGYEKDYFSLKDSFYGYLMKDHTRIFLDLKLHNFNDNVYVNSDLDFRDIFKDSKEPFLEVKNFNEEELNPENYFVNNNLMTIGNETNNNSSSLPRKKFSIEEPQLSEVSKKKELDSDAKIDSRPIHGDNSVKNNHKLHENNKTKKSNAFARLMVSHKEGKGIGYEKGYTSLKGDFYAYLVKDHTNMFFDVRLHFFNDGTYAANSGIGFRHALKDSNNTLGFNVYYDSRKIRGRSLFNQIGIGLEYLGIVDCRLNGYIPIQKRKKFKGSSEKDYHDGYKMIKKRYKKSLASVAFEIGHYLVDYKNFKMYGAVGQYYLETGNCTMAFGGNSRLNFDIGKYVSIEFAGTYDTLFKARAQGIIKLNFTWGRSKKKNRDLLKPTNHRDIIPLKNTYKYSWNW